MEINISIENDRLSEEELKKLVQCIRDIEQNKPERHIDIFVNSPDSTVEEMKRIISSVDPGFPFVKVLDIVKK